MYCAKCESEIQGDAVFCPKCGMKLSKQLNAKQKTNIHRKKFLITAVAVLVMILIGAALLLNHSASQSYESYEDVLQICCDAINKKDKTLLDDVVYETLGSDWNNEYVYNTVDAYYDYQTYHNENYGELTTAIESYYHYTSESDLSNIEDYIFRQTNRIIAVDEAYEIEMDNESCMEIYLIKVEGRWYVLYLDL